MVAFEFTFGEKTIGGNVNELADLAFPGSRSVETNHTRFSAAFYGIRVNLSPLLIL